MSDPLPCFACGKTLDKVPYFEGDIGPAQPYDGVWFDSGGNYGSSVWDDMNAMMRICICDHCLRAAPDERIWRYRLTNAPAQIFEYGYGLEKDEGDNAGYGMGG